MTTLPPTASQWPPINPANPAPRSTAWSKAALAGAIILSTAALIVALMRPTTSSPNAATTAAPPTYTAAETSAAHKKVCEVYRLAARAVKIATNGSERALANIAPVNGAVMLQRASNTTPALSADERSAALAQAEAYSNTTAVAMFATERDDPTWQAAAQDANAKDARMKALCGGD